MSLHARRGGEIPWRRPRFEVLLLVLVGIAALSTINPTSVQDVSRLCLTQSIVHGHLNVDRCIGTIVDRSIHNGHLYTNKAPGMSVLEVPTAEALRLPAPEHWKPDGDAKLWTIRLLSSGLGFMLCAFLVGRISEGIAPGFGGAALVAGSLGTLMAPLAIENFDQVPTAALAFAAFALAWWRRPLLAGLAAGAALTIEYQAAPILLIVGGYVLLHDGLRALGRYAAGTAPGIVLLGAYDWAAFGAPWEDPLRNADNGYRPLSRSGVLGVHLPSAHGAWRVFFSDRGLLVTSPILVAAAIGLVLLWRRGYRLEAGVCAVTTAVFVLASCGYFDPYGGLSPGPRYLVPALPFLALGLGPMFAARPLATGLLAIASIIATAGVTVSWASGVTYRHTVWRELAPFPGELGSSRVVDYLEKNVLGWLGVNVRASALLVGAIGLAALAISVPADRR